MWELVICIGVSWLGCGVFDTSYYSSKEECFEVLSKVLYQDTKSNESDNRRDIVSYCRYKKG